MRIFDNHVQLSAVAGGKQHGFGNIIVIAQAAQNTCHPVIGKIKTFTDLNGGGPVIES